MTEVSRRRFLGAAAAGAATLGLGLAACSPTNNSASGGAASEGSSGIPATWDAEADVVILGAGGTGLAAACAAAGAGASVLVYDVDIRAGGTTALSGGVIQAAGTAAQKEFTTFQSDTPANHAACYLEQAEHLADEALVKALCDRAPERIEWLESIGIKWVSVYGNCHVPYVTEGLHADRIHVYEGGGAGGDGIVMTDAEYNAAVELGAAFEFECKAERLIHTAEQGVVGVVVSKGGSSLNVKANKGVIMALGGIDHNVDLAQAINPQQHWALTEQVCAVSPNNKGEGILMGIEVNAALATVGGTICVEGSGQGTSNASVQIPCIFVNGAGNRFVCEDATYAYMMRAIFQQERQLGKPTYMIMDQNMVELGAGPWAADPAAAVAEGALFQADTLEDLAAQIEVPAATLVRAMAGWNDAIAQTGTDIEYSRNTQLIALNKPPYYARRNTSGNLGSLGGLKINANAEVISNTGEVIPRLYAGGMNSGGWYGMYYPGSGTSLCGGLVFGTIAGEQAAAAEAWG